MLAETELGGDRFLRKADPVTGRLLPQGCLLLSFLTVPSVLPTKRLVCETGLELSQRCGYLFSKFFGGWIAARSVCCGLGPV